MSSRQDFKNQASSVPPLRFPQKLWKIANECQSGAVAWSPDGKSILLRYSLFKEEFMSTKNDFFKTDNISSFVRQLNLYGFRKIYDHAQKQAYKANPDLHEFANDNFQRNRPDLLDGVTRKSGVLKDRNEFSPEHFKNSELNGIYCSNKWEASNDKDNIGTPIKDDTLNEELKSSVLADNIQNSAHNTDAQSFANNQPITATNSTANVPTEPIKKKRGRKPGSKRSTNKPQLITKFRKCEKPCPSLKYAEKYPHLIYFNDEDQSVFLRNTSPDVMLSSTLPFEESPEYQELKDTYHRLYDPKLRMQYASLPLNIAKFSRPNRNLAHDRILLRF